MKTITEYNGFDLQSSTQKIQEWTAAGKTPEECQQALAEAKKLEGDKLKFYLHALDLAKAKPQGLKRIMVFTLAENEKGPGGAQKFEEHYFLSEYYPQPQNQKRGGRDRDEGRGGRGGKRGDKRGGKKGRRGPRNGERNARGEGGEARRDAPARGDRPPRGPRPPRSAPLATGPSSRPGFVVKPKDTSGSTPTAQAAPDSLQAVRTAAAEALKQSAPSETPGGETPSST